MRKRGREMPLAASPFACAFLHGSLRSPEKKSLLQANKNTAFTAFQYRSDLQITLSMYNLIQPVTTLSGKPQTQGSSIGHCHLLSVKNGLQEKSKKMKSCFFIQKMHFWCQCIWHESTTNNIIGDTIFRTTIFMWSSESNESLAICRAKASFLSYF